MTVKLNSSWHFQNYEAMADFSNAWFFPACFKQF